MSALLEWWWSQIAATPVSSINTVLNGGIILALYLHSRRLERVLRLTGYLSRVEEWDRIQESRAYRQEQATHWAHQLRSVRKQQEAVQ
jgi:hypothetical protein